jgi:hypothetical protein
MLCDGNIFNYGYIGSRATGNGRMGSESELVPFH